eukprot:TRINITY_DN5542_c0_g1_i1.p3 TRINITY_DN5542_c0_g1~~TRINITY_DN5542_c0_g1_i1.p3  ORF type:complete len:184 (-),score=36.69 TRINITY_DN5542_c0_g1_i1:284-835(-)
MVENDKAPDGERETKRQRKGFEGYLLNLQEALVKEYEDKSLGEILLAPVSALQGVGPKGQRAFNAVGIETVRELAEWKYFKIAKALVTLKPLSGESRIEGSLMNIDKAVIKKYEMSSLADICAASIDALEGITEEDAVNLLPIHVQSVEDLGTLKYCEWASAILELSRFEVMEVVNRELKNLE